MSDMLIYVIVHSHLFLHLAAVCIIFSCFGGGGVIVFVLFCFLLLFVVCSIVFFPFSKPTFVIQESICSEAFIFIMESLS